MNSSLMKRLSDQTYSQYTAMIDGFLKNALKWVINIDIQIYNN